MASFGREGKINGSNGRMKAIKSKTYRAAIAESKKLSIAYISTNMTKPKLAGIEI